MKYKPVGTPSSHRIHGAAIYTMGNIFIYGNMDPINIPPVMLALIYQHQPESRGYETSVR
jgi:hypothetical protein